ncbi:MAG: hypothetical protein KJ052_09620, partial [Candidatus Hydrogenedentes bacterium]|nr:hypothetical protein [Candidatus Hydrogenedentota bacterium]
GAGVSVRGTGRTFGAGRIPFARKQHPRDFQTGSFEIHHHDGLVRSTRDSSPLQSYGMLHEVLKARILVAQMQDRQTCQTGYRSLALLMIVNAAANLKP